MKYIELFTFNQTINKLWQYFQGILYKNLIEADDNLLFIDFLQKGVKYEIKNESRQ